MRSFSQLYQHLTVDLLTSYDALNNRAKTAPMEPSDQVLDCLLYDKMTQIQRQMIPEEKLAHDKYNVHRSSERRLLFYSNCCLSLHVYCQC